MEIISNIRKSLMKSPARFLAIGFFLVILTGALLLMLPISSKDGAVTPFIDCLLTATSAVCVTGLVVYETAAHWTNFGHVVIISLIQFGGLGLMTWATLIALLLKKKITMTDRILIHDQMNVIPLQGMVKLIINVLKYTFVIEGIGALILSLTFIPEYGLLKGIWFSVFHSISAFCNAGFDIIGPVSVTGYNDRIMVVGTIMALIVLGGIGFGVMTDVLTAKKPKNYKAHTKLALTITACLIFFGSLLIFIFEYNNPNTIGNSPMKTKVLVSMFQAVTARTAGYISIDQTALKEATIFITIILMFIGGSPGGTAGGIKTTTFGLLVGSLVAEIKGAKEVHFFQRSVETSVVLKALSVIMISLIWVISITLILSITENKPILDLLYEATSATATVGVTRDVTPHLSFIGKSLITASMFLGRLGPMTIAFALSNSKSANTFKYPKTDILVG